MIAKEFNQLDINSKAEIVWDSGTLVDQRKKGYHIDISMHTVESFYVEIWYDNKQNIISDIRALESDKDWEGFLGSVNIKYLMA